MCYFSQLNDEVFIEEHYKYSLDWLNGVLPIAEVDDFLNFLESLDSRLKFTSWRPQPKGIYGYTTRLCHLNRACLTIAWNQDELEDRLWRADMSCNNKGIFISFSGDGLRYLGDTVVQKLIYFLYFHGFQASRIDTALDILDCDNPVIPLVTEAFHYALHPRENKLTITTNLHRTRNNFRMNKYTSDDGEVYYNCQLGNHGTRSGMLRVYNKRDEIFDTLSLDIAQTILDSYAPEGYWWRMECELHKDKAKQAFSALAEVVISDSSEIGLNCVFASAIDFLLDIVICHNECLASSDFQLAEEWSGFLEFIGRTIHLVQFVSVPYIPASVGRMQKWMKQIIGAVVCARKCFTDNEWDELIKIGELRYAENKKYDVLKDELEQLKFDIA